jgi:hypothetical protein
VTEIRTQSPGSFDAPGEVCANAHPGVKIEERALPEARPRVPPGEAGPRSASDRPLRFHIRRLGVSAHRSVQRCALVFCASIIWHHADRRSEKRLSIAFTMSDLTFRSRPSTMELVVSMSVGCSKEASARAPYLDP